MNDPAEEAFWNLVSAARAEDGISPDERRVLNAYTLKLGLDPARAREIQAAAEAETPPKLRVPKDGKSRLDTLRRVLEVVAADGTIAPKELRLIQALAERCAISSDTLTRLLAVALRKSAPKLDQAFATLSAAGDVGPELMELPKPKPAGPPGVPCASCGLPFVSRDRYACYCRSCVATRNVRNPRPAFWMGVSFVVFLFVAGFIVEKRTRLWSLGLEARREVRELDRRHSPWRRLRDLGEYMFIPALLLTIVPAWLGSWAVHGIVARAAKRKR